MKKKLISLLCISFAFLIQVKAQEVAVHLSEDGVLKICKQRENKIHDCESRRTNVKFAVINADQTMIAIVYKDGKLEMCKIKGTHIDVGVFDKENVASVEFGLQNTLIVTFNDNKMEYCEIHERRLHHCKRR